MERDVTILIADNHAMFRDSLRCLLEQEPDFRIVGEAADGREVVERARKLNPGILLLDQALPRLAGEQVLKKVFDLCSGTRVIMLATAIDRDDMLEILKFGARGVVLKDSPTNLLFKAIRTVAAGELWIGHSAATVLLDYLQAESGKASRPRARFRLSRREREIVSAIAEGLTNRDLARKLSISEQTVKRHLTNIFKKVGVANRLELALLAVRHKFTA